MLTAIEFGNEVERLHRAFGINVDDRIEAKVGEWFELWRQFYSETSMTILKAMVNRAIKEFERIPSFAQFKSLREQALSGLPRQGYAKRPCMSCEGSGVVSAWRDEPGYGPASYAFRCGSCENWRGVCDGITSWNDDREGQGYQLGEMPRQQEKPAATYEPKTMPAVKEAEMQDEIPF